MNVKSLKIFSAYFFSEFGRAMYLIVIGWLLYDLTKDPFYTGLLVSVGFIPGLILNLVIGVIVDRIDRKFLAFSANIISALDMILIFSVIYIGIVKPWMIMGVHMLLQVMGSLFRIAMQSYVSEGYKKVELPDILSKAGASAQIGALIGASTGGLIIAFSSMTTSMLVVIVSYLLATFFVYFTDLQVNNQLHKSKSSIIANLFEGFLYLRENRFLFGLFSISFVGQMVFHNSVIFLSVYTREFLNKSTTTYGLLDATISIGGILAGIYGALWWRKSGKYVVVYSLTIIFAGLLTIGISPILPVSFLGVFLIGLGTTWVRIFMQTIQQIATDSQYRGRVSSYRILFNQGSVVISGPILGWIATNYSVNMTYLALSLPIIMIIIFSYFQAKQERFKEITKSIYNK